MNSSFEWKNEWVLMMQTALTQNVNYHVWNNRRLICKKLVKWIMEVDTKEYDVYGNKRFVVFQKEAVEASFDKS